MVRKVCSLCTSEDVCGHTCFTCNGSPCAVCAGPSLEMNTSTGGILEILSSEEDHASGVLTDKHKDVCLVIRGDFNDAPSDSIDAEKSKS